MSVAKSEVIDRKQDNVFESDQTVMRSNSLGQNTQNIQSQTHLRKRRNGHASYLTTLLQKSRSYLDRQCSKVLLQNERKRIEDALHNLKAAHCDYVKTLFLREQITEASDWFEDRHALAKETLTQLNEALGMSSKASTKSSVSSRAKLLLQMQQAQLKATHAKQDAELADKAAELEVMKVKQQSRQNVEMAELEVNVLKEIIDTEDGVRQVLESDKHQFVKDWVEQHSQSCKDEPKLVKSTCVNEVSSKKPLNPLAPCWVQTKADVHTRPLNTQNQQTRQETPSSKAQDSIDDWIDNLKPEKETTFSTPHISTSDRLAETLLKMEGERDLPKVDLPTFSGSPLEWPRFVEQFNIQVHNRPGVTDARRMDLLQSHLRGEAHLLVQGLGYSGKNYALALQELKNSFGHRVRVARAFLSQVTNGPSIPSQDPHALRKFYVSVRDCVTTLSQLNYMSDLGSCEILMKAAKRLPSDKTNGWNEFVKTVTKSREPSLLDLQRWLKDRVDADFNPYAITSVKPVNKPAKPQNLSAGKQSTLYATNSQSSQPKQGNTNKQNPQEIEAGEKVTPKGDFIEGVLKMPCPMCKEAHYLYRCPLFSNKSVEERRQIIPNYSLCFNCLKPGHSAAKCFSIMRCREWGCGKKHHTMLHLKQAENTKVNKKIKSGNYEQVYFRLIPVIAIGNNGVVVETVAMLDSASDISLIDIDLSKQLGLRGQQRSLTVNTLTSVTQCTSSKVSFCIRPVDSLNSRTFAINEAWTVNSDAFKCPPQVVRPEWSHIKDLNIPNIEPSQVKVLIGLNLPEAHLQVDVVAGDKCEPYAVRTMIGWSLMGVGTCLEESLQARVNFTVLENTALIHQVENFWKTEAFGVAYKEKRSTSVEDRRAQVILEESTKLVEGHYQVGMLWKQTKVNLPNNRSIAEKRFKSLAKKLVNDQDLALVYKDTLNKYIESGHARKLTEDELSHTSMRTWYLPHHGVVNPNKPGKVRVVFDAASCYMDTSLNANLMTGPDLLNSLFGVLVRFRLNPIALAADIEGMFHQVRVSEMDADSLRFLWKTDLSTPCPPDVYKMMVHIFGATDSPTCANYAVKRTALDNEKDFSPSTVQAVMRDFYVDDFLKSVETPDEAIELSQEISMLMKCGGFRLHKWTSNSVEVLEAIPESERAIKTLDLDLDESPIQRALGLKWNILSDCFVFNQALKDCSPTKRGIVSTVSSIFDPCGFLAPFTLRAKCLIQELWRQKLDWDDVLPDKLKTQWEEWLSELAYLSNFKLPRHHLSLTSQSQNLELHMFCDASERSFGAVAYLRYTSGPHITCSFVSAKTHVAPIKPELTIPRLELQGAVLAVRLWNSLKAEFMIDIHKVVFWTDSNTVLQYVNNETKRFKQFVSNRVAEILETTNSNQWRHVSSSNNPADHCTRGLSARKLSTSHPWIQGPNFLWKGEDTWTSHTVSPLEVSDSDPELKANVLHVSTKQGDMLAEKSIFSEVTLSTIIRASDFSSWHRLCKRTAWILRALRNFLSTLDLYKIKPITQPDLLPSEYEEATLCWVQQAQQDMFPVELRNLKKGDQVPETSKLLPLSPVFDGRHLRVGGRLRKSCIPIESKFQLLLPRDHKITELILSDIHVKTAHGGPEHIICYLRRKFWPLSARRLAKQTIRKCLYCHKQRVMPVIPKMADLPGYRVCNFEGPFIHTGVDYFGPMYVKVRRSELKRWGCLFTCLSTRAVHIELADSLETDDFILLLRNFIGRRGHPKHIYSDNGTNFVGANNELRQCLKDLKQGHIIDCLAAQAIQWHFNPPANPHFGGAWERLVRSTKTALRATLNGQLVSESVLRSALIEVEAVLNSRPLTHNSSDPNDYTALTPNHFLLGRADTSVPPDVFDNREINSRRRWRQAQVIADHVSRRWLTEYLPELTIRHRWTKDNACVSVGDLVLVIAENNPRGQWDLGRISEVFSSDDGRIRTVRVKTPKGEYLRPVAKICVLEENVP